MTQQTHFWNKSKEDSNLKNYMYSNVTAALFTIVKTWQQHKYPLIYEWIKKIWYIYTMEYAAAAAKLLQSCPTLCDPIDGSPPGSPVPGILQTRTLAWVAISFSNAWKWKVKVKSLSHVRLLAAPWAAAFQAPPSMGFSRQEYWSGLPLPSLQWNMTQPFKKNKIMPFAVLITWTDLEIIILGQVNQTEKDKYHVMSLTCEI